MRGTGVCAEPECVETVNARQHGRLHTELLAGLKQEKKHINPKFFYDELGSQLFDQITALPEYYPARTEKHILSEHAASIGAAVGLGGVLIEPGAGSCEKVRLLLNDVKPSAYIPVDISGKYLQDAAKELETDFPWLDVHPVAHDFCEDIPLPDVEDAQHRVVFYPGSTIGNFEPPQAEDFLGRMRHLAGDDGGMILGADLQKAPEILNKAYNDSQGITGKFNRNILNNVNALLGSDFNPSQFDHRAFYNEQAQRIEMHLVSRKAQKVRLGEASVDLAQGEHIHTENSYKYTPGQLDELAARAGFRLERTWTDPDRLFSVNYLSAA